MPAATGFLGGVGAPPQPGVQNRGGRPPFKMPRQPRSAARTAAFMPAPTYGNPRSEWPLPCPPWLAAAGLVPAVAACAIAQSQLAGGAGGQHKASEARASNLRQLELFFNTIVAGEVREKTLASLDPAKQSVWSALVTEPADRIVLKNRYSALIPGSSALERAKNKRCYANTLRPRSRMLLKVMKGG
jgi:hypothetical protein